VGRKHQRFGTRVVGLPRNRSVSQKFLRLATPSLASGAGVSLTINMFSERRSLAAEVRLPQDLFGSSWVQKNFSRVLEPSRATRYRVPTPTSISAAILFQPTRIVPKSTLCGGLKANSVGCLFATTYGEAEIEGILADDRAIR
jgi:hypothetical protein